MKIRYFFFLLLILPTLLFGKNEANKSEEPAIEISPFDANDIVFDYDEEGYLEFEEFTELTPSESFFTDYFPEYNMLVNKHLVEDKFGMDNRNLEFLFIEIPSFIPEIVLGMHKKEDQYYIKAIIPKNSIWHSMDEKKWFFKRKLKVAINVFEKPISKKLADDLNFLWQSMLLRTSYPPIKRNHTGIISLMCDGTSYKFVKCLDYGKISGEANNPDFGSKPYLLAEIGKSLVKYVQDNEYKIQDLIVQINELKNY
ncbi:MAG: hypothetical protein K8S23_01805 [Candidatus Cloacimonetes bacterium]|nr:hypothetical protein [Candidatus Cloacimonadota bacterium]